MEGPGGLSETSYTVDSGAGMRVQLLGIGRGATLIDCLSIADLDRRLKDRGEGDEHKIVWSLDKIARGFES